jgi:hypothetical protein
MPASEVMGKFKRGELHSGSKKGPKVTSRKQAIAIMMSEKRKGMKYEAHGSGKFSSGEMKQGFKVMASAKELHTMDFEHEHMMAGHMMAMRKMPMMKKKMKMEMEMEY